MPNTSAFPNQDTNPVDEGWYKRVWNRGEMGGLCAEWVGQDTFSRPTGRQGRRISKMTYSTLSTSTSESAIDICISHPATGTVEAGRARKITKSIVRMNEIGSLAGTPTYGFRRYRQFHSCCWVAPEANTLFKGTGTYQIPVLGSASLQSSARGFLLATTALICEDESGCVTPILQMLRRLLSLAIFSLQHLVFPSPSCSAAPLLHLLMGFGPKYRNFETVHTLQMVEQKKAL